MPRTFKLTIAYDGTDFAGWQVQNGQRTLQGVLEDALTQITGRPVRVFASGRTDAGVHALAQVASCELETALPLEVLQKALNCELPHDMAMLAVEEAAPRFNARKEAKRKRYRYLVHDGPLRDVFQLRYAWTLYQRLDVPAMQRAAAGLVGRRDFASFESGGSQRETTERTIFDLSIRRLNLPSTIGCMADAITTELSHGEREQHEAGSFVQFELEADGFLYNMVRNIVGTLVEVGKGNQPESWVAEVLAALDRRRAGQTAPPQGLFLVKVKYGENVE